MRRKLFIVTIVAIAALTGCGKTEVNEPATTSTEVTVDAPTTEYEETVVESEETVVEPEEETAVDSEESTEVESEEPIAEEDTYELPGVVETDWTNPENIYALGDIIRTLPTLDSFKQYFMQYGEPTKIDDPFSPDGVTWDLSDNNYKVIVTYDINNSMVKACDVIFKPLSGESSSTYFIDVVTNFSTRMEGGYLMESSTMVSALDAPEVFSANYFDGTDTEKPAALNMQLQVRKMQILENR